MKLWFIKCWRHRSHEWLFCLSPYYRISVSAFSRCWFVSLFFIFVMPQLATPAFADARIPSHKIKLSTPSARNVLSGRIMPPELKVSSWKKYNYEAGLGLFGESHKAYPTIFILANKGKNTIGLSYFNSTAPFIKDEYDFLRSNDIAVERTINSVLVGVSTVTYITDEIAQFHNRTQIFDFLYMRNILSGREKYELSFIFGIPITYHSYSVRCTLDNNGGNYSESDSSFGTGLSIGLKFSAANSLFLNKGIVFSAGAIYRKIWFKNIAGKIDGALRSEISGFRIFLNTAWRFNFYN